MLKEILLDKQSSSNVAVIYKDNEYTYNQIYRSVISHVDNIFGASGKNVGLFIQNSVEYVIGYFAISFANKVDKSYFILRNI